MGVEAPEVLPLLFSCGIRVLVVDVERTLAEEVVPILQGRRRNRAVSPVGPLEGGEKATLVVDAGVVDTDDVAVPLDNEKYEGLSVNMRIQGHRTSSANSYEDAFCLVVQLNLFLASFYDLILQIIVVITKMSWIGR